MDTDSKTSIKDDLKALASFTDILYLTDKEQIQPAMRRFFRQKKLSFLNLQPDKFYQVNHRLDLIGTVIIDSSGVDVSRSQKMAQIIESLEQNSIGIIFLNSQVEPSAKSFSLAPHDQSFSLSGTLGSSFLDDLWIRISVNLAYRKQSPGIIVKPATPPKKTITHCGNRLSDQLKVTEAMIENLSEQLRLAGRVQRDFLPAHLPNTEKIKWVTSYMPAEWVSGDIYDIARLDEKYIGFYLADAVGHSMPAALLTMFIKQALVMRETKGDKHYVFTPAEVMKNLNLRMAGQKLSGYQFATCCYCLLDTESLELIYARAGHPYPILIRPGQQPEQLQIRGSLLGVFGLAMYMQQTVQLRSGDKLILYSDGIEPFIGAFDDKKGFIFSKEFLEMKDLQITEIFDRLNILAQEKPIDPAEFDDMTMLGLELS